MKRPSNGGRYKLIFAFSFSLILLMAAISLLPSYAQSGNLIEVGSGLSPDDPKIAASGKSVYIVWEDRFSVDGNIDIFFVRSTDAGATFDKPINLSNNDFDNFEPVVAASGTNVFVVWQSAGDIIFIKSEDLGVTFSDPLNLSDTPRPFGNPSIALTSENNVVVAWYETASSGNKEIFVISGNGDRFGNPINVSNDDDHRSVFPSLTTAGDNVFVVWERGIRDEIMLASSTDGGNSFAKPINISNDTNDSFDAKIAAGEDRIYVSWRVESSEEVQSDKTVRLGLAGNIEKTLELREPSTLAASGSMLFYTTIEGSTIRLQRSNDFGDTLSSFTDVNTNGNSADLSITLSGDNVYLSFLKRNVEPFVLMFTSLPIEAEETGQQDTEDDEQEPPATEPQEPPGTEQQDNTIRVQHEDHTFDVQASLTNGNITGTEVDDSLRLVLNLNMTKSGTLTITLPRELIDAKNPDGTDREFFILRGGQFLTFTEVNSTDTERTLQIFLRQPGDSQVKIEGTHVIPEFPVPLLVMAIFIGTIVILTKRPSLLLRR